jgi:hypothetical protein
MIARQQVLASEHHKEKGRREAFCATQQLAITHAKAQAFTHHWVRTTTGPGG